MGEEENAKGSIFFSRSLDDEVSPFTKAIKNYLKNNYGFDNYVTIGLTYLRDDKIYDLIEEKIKETDFTICCFTQDYKTDKNEFLSKASVYMEYAMAKMLKKTVISFVEKEVIINTMVKSSTLYVEISRENLLNLKSNNNEIKEFIYKTNSLIKNSIPEYILKHYAINKW